MTVDYTCTRKTREFAAVDEIFSTVPGFDAVSRACFAALCQSFSYRMIIFHLRKNKHGSSGIWSDTAAGGNRRPFSLVMSLLMSDEPIYNFMSQVIQEHSDWWNTLKSCRDVLFLCRLFVGSLPAC